MLEVKSTAIPDVKIVAPQRFGDDRGFLSEVYSRHAFARAGIDLEFVQDNHSFSAGTGTVRGLHFQTAPFAQAKLIRVTRGRILDLALDIRKSSLTFGRHVAVELSAKNWLQLYVPIGFAHGFCTLEDDTEVAYKVTNYYSAADDRGLAWDDPAFGIQWPVTASKATLSDRDRRQPRLAEYSDFFP